MGGRRGFTLIELLVVIAILAVLAVAVVLVLNPAELLKEGRDSTRISDLAAMNSALGIWTADVIGGSTWPSVTTYNCTASTTKPTGTGACSLQQGTKTDGTGWIPVDFRLIASGSPLPRLPLDPNNGAACLGGKVCQYAMAASTTVGAYELDAAMESTKFFSATSTRVVTNDEDGGNDAAIYETGSNLTLF